MTPQDAIALVGNGAIGLGAWFFGKGVLGLLASANPEILVGLGLLIAGFLIRWVFP